MKTTTQLFIEKTFKQMHRNANLLDDKLLFNTPTCPGIRQSNLPYAVTHGEWNNDRLKQVV